MKTSKNPMIDEDGEVRELKGSDFKRARKASDVFSGSLQAKLGMAKPTNSHAKVQSPRKHSEHDRFDDVGPLADVWASISSEDKDSSRDRVKVASSKLSLNTSHIMQARLESYQLSQTYLSALNLDVFKVLVHHAVETSSIASASEHDDILANFATVKDSVKPSHRTLDRMRKSTLTEVVKLQSEMLESFKVLFTVASSGTLAGVASGGSTLLTHEMEKAGLAKRLREIAEEVEMTTVLHESRA